MPAALLPFPTGWIKGVGGCQGRFWLNYDDKSIGWTQQHSINSMLWRCHLMFGVCLSHCSRPRQGVEPNDYSFSAAMWACVNANQGKRWGRVCLVFSDVCFFLWEISLTCLELCVPFIYLLKIKFFLLQKSRCLAFVEVRICDLFFGLWKVSLFLVCGNQKRSFSCEERRNK